MQEFGNRVRAAREENQLTQHDLAREVECHVGTIGRIERGEDLPGLMLGCKIARALGKHIYYLTGIIPEPTMGTQLTAQEAKLNKSFREMTPEEQKIYGMVIADYHYVRKIGQKV